MKSKTHTQNSENWLPGEREGHSQKGASRWIDGTGNVVFIKDGFFAIYTLYMFLYRFFLLCMNVSCIHSKS